MSEDLLTRLAQTNTSQGEETKPRTEDDPDDPDLPRSEQVQILKGLLSRISDTFSAKKSSKTSPSRSPDRRARWRKALGEALESTPCHIFIVVLLLVDLLATAIDILKTMHNNTSDLNTCARFLEACYCVSTFEKSKSWEFLHWIGISILSVLLLNAAGLMTALGWSYFLHPGYVLDLLVVATALILEIFLDADTAGLLIILNLWRIVRVAHGIFEVTDEAWEKDMQKLEERIRFVESAYDRDQELLNHRDQEISQLKLQLNSSNDNNNIID